MNFPQRIVLVAICCMAIFQFGKAQGEANRWYFGDQAGLNFSGGSPVSLNGSAMNTNGSPITVCDANGDVLFYGNNTEIWNAAHNSISTFTTGPIINPMYSSFALPRPGTPSEYYYFTYQQFLLNGNLKYATVDMSLNGGMGALSSGPTNMTVIGDPPTMTAARHANGTDYWMVTQGNGFLYAFHVQNSDPNTFVTNVANGGSSVYTALRFNPQGNQLVGISPWNTDIQLYDFDQNTGILTFNGFLNNPGALIHALEFSCDGERLYASNGDSLFQWDMSQTTISAINNSRTAVGSHAGATVFGLQLGPDRKIYVSFDSTVLGVINEPKVLGVGCNFTTSGPSVAPNTSGLDLPNFPPFYFDCAQGVLSSNFCQNDSTTFWVNDSLSVDSVQWDFGDPASGMANSATGKLVHHVFSTSGSFSVTALLYTQSQIDTLIQPVTIDTNLVVDLGPDPVLCAGDSLVIGQDLGPVDYLWNTGNTATFQTVNAPGQYWVGATNECGTMYDTVSVSGLTAPQFNGPFVVQPCIGDTAILDASYPSSQYLWSDGNTNGIRPALFIGTYTVTVTNTCGSTTETYEVQPAPFDSVTVTSCDPLIVGSHTLDSSGVYPFYFSNPLGCDSVVVYDYQRLYPVQSLIQETSCAPITFFGNTLDQTGTYTGVTSGSNGCDSTVTLEFQYEPLVATIEEDTAVVGFEGPNNMDTYQWYACVNDSLVILPDDTNQWFEGVQVDQAYALVVTNNGCTDTSACITLGFSSARARIAAGEDRFTVSPNPTNGRLIIKGSAEPSGTAVQLQLVDMAGKMVLSRTVLVNEETELNVRPGVYGLRIVQQDGSTEYHKLVVR